MALVQFRVWESGRLVLERLTSIVLVTDSEVFKAVTKLSHMTKLLSASA